MLNQCNSLTVWCSCIVWDHPRIAWTIWSSIFGEWSSLCLLWHHTAVVGNWTPRPVTKKNTNWKRMNLVELMAPTRGFTGVFSKKTLWGVKNLQTWAPQQLMYIQAEGSVSVSRFLYSTISHVVSFYVHFWIDCWNNWPTTVQSSRFNWC